MTDSKLSFSIEVANTIGLEEAILLEHLRRQESLNKKNSLKSIFSDLAFWSDEKTGDLLSSLVKTGLVVESNFQGISYFSSKKPQQLSLIHI